MKLNLTENQLRKARNGHAFQVKMEQMGSGFSYNLSPANIKKLQNAHRLGKGSRITLSGGEIEMNGAGLNKAFKKGMKTVGREISRGAKKYITKDNAMKALKYGNKILDKAGLDSAQSMLINEGVNFLPVPATLKTVLANNLEKQADREIARQGGAGFNFKKHIARPGLNLAKKHITKQNINKALKFGNKIARESGYDDNLQTMAVKKLIKNPRLHSVLTDEFDSYMDGSGINPYLPTGMLGGKMKITSKGNKVFDDHHNVLRKGQAGFSGMSVQQAEALTTKAKGKCPHCGHMSGGSFKTMGGSFKN